MERTMIDAILAILLFSGFFISFILFIKFCQWVLSRREITS